MVNTAATDHHGPFHGLRKGHCILRAVADNHVSYINILLGQNYIDPVGKGLPTGKICQGYSVHNGHGTPGSFPKKLSVNSKGNGIRAAFANAPVIIYFSICHLNLLWESQNQRYGTGNLQP